MPAKGTDAKSVLLNRFIEAVGSDYIGSDSTGKKFYFRSKENGNDVQVCVQMTVPKVQMVASEPDDTPSASSAMTEDEKAVLERLVKDLGL